jgi:glyoxylase-like metal-dependent hydrolase (beta-lactamase superfamily II)/rhodanese-related sulfurtransferase
MSQTAVANTHRATLGSLTVLPLLHPQGCRGYVVADPASRQALAIDIHLDLVEDAAAAVQQNGWKLPYVVDTHTHADHPSGSAALAARMNSTRIAHHKANHRGVSRHPADGDVLHLGDQVVTVRHAPGHTPDHLVLLIDGAVFAGDTLLIGGMARTDFLGGDAGQLFDSLQRVLGSLPDATVLYPGHDYEGRVRSTLGQERQQNPWLLLGDRETFVRQLRANPPPRPANMDDLLRLNREGQDIPTSIPAAEAMRLVAAGGQGSVIDVRTGAEFDGEHIAGSRLLPLDQLAQSADQVRATPAPRLLLCRTGSRATMARDTLQRLHIGGLTVIEGGIEAYKAAGGQVERGQGVISLERQVRIAAGLIVLAGVLLANVVHPGFVWLSGFVGAGLVFAGITDWCGMGLLIARAPWNRRSNRASSGIASACAASAPSACAASAPAPASCAASGCAAPVPTTDAAPACALPKRPQSS